jgi:hypothetical protein
MYSYIGNPLPHFPRGVLFQLMKRGMMKGKIKKKIWKNKGGSKVKGKIMEKTGNYQQKR